MANICFTKYVVEGEMSELKDLYAKMKSLEEGKAPLVDEGAFAFVFLVDKLALNHYAF